MGLDLTISFQRYGPYRPDGPLNWHLGHDRLHLDRDYRIFAQIARVLRESDEPLCHPKPVPDWVQVHWYEDNGLRRITEDAYCSPLTYLTAGEMARVETPPDASVWNRAVWAMIRALPVDTPIILYWC